MTSLLVVVACVFAFLGFSASLEPQRGQWLDGSPQPSGVPPATVIDASFTIDPANSDSVILFGGVDVDPTNQIFSYSMSGYDWTDLSPATNTPPPRSEHTAVQGGSNNGITIFGGGNAVTEFNDTIKYNSAGNQFTFISTTGGIPHSRRGHTAVVSNGVMIVFGGAYNSNQNFLNDVPRFKLGTSTWNLTAAANTAPSPRCHHSAVTYTLNGSPKMIIHAGGLGDDASLQLNSDTWFYDIATHSWDPQPPTPGGDYTKDPTQFQCTAHTAVVTSFGTMLVYGGIGSGGDVLSRVLEYNIVGNYWTILAPSGTVPSARIHHQAIILPAVGLSETMIIFGGAGSLGKLNDIEQFTWAPQSTTGVGTGAAVTTAAFTTGVHKKKSTTGVEHASQSANDGVRMCLSSAVFLLSVLLPALF